MKKTFRHAIPFFLALLWLSGSSLAQGPEKMPMKPALMSHESRYTNMVEEVFDTVSYNTLKVMLENAQH